MHAPITDKYKNLWPPTCHGRWMEREFQPRLASVIVPTYNRAALLPEALDSVLEQTYRPIELIVADDGSTDETADVLARWEEKCAEKSEISFRLLRQPNRGAAAARNLGLIHSHGEYIQFLDSDDLFLPGKIQAQVEGLESNDGYDFVWSQTSKFSGSPHVAVPFCGGDTDAPLEGFVRFSSWPWHVWGGLFRREAARRLGPWDERMRCWDDWEYMVRFLCNDPHVRHVPGTYSLARVHEKGRLFDLGKTQQGVRSRLQEVELVQEMLEKAGQLRPAFRRELSKYFYWVGRSAMRADLAEVAREAFGRARQAPPGGLWSIRLALAAALVSILGPGWSCRLLSPFSRME